MPAEPQDDRLRSGKKAAGAALVSVGGVSLVNGLKIMEGGTLSIDNSMHLMMPDGVPRRGAQILDKPAASTENATLRCDEQWSVGNFKLGYSDILDGATSLDSRVEAAARAITRDAPVGTVLLIGSGDNQPPRSINVKLATERADSVKTLLATQLKKLDAGASRDVISANAALSTTGPTIVPGQVSNGLARLLYGEKEMSARTVMTCVMVPSTLPTASTVADKPAIDPPGGESSFLKGMVVGMTVTNAMVVATFLTAVVLAVILTLRWLDRRSSKTEKPEGEPDNESSGANKIADAPPTAGASNA